MAAREANQEVKGDARNHCKFSELLVEISTARMGNLTLSARCITNLDLCLSTG